MTLGKKFYANNLSQFQRHFSLILAEFYVLQLFLNKIPTVTFSILIFLV